MGRKKRNLAQLTKPWCFYCDKEFPHEPILVKHQQEVHYRCVECRKKVGGSLGMIKHWKEVHKSEIKLIPNALPDRSDITKFDVRGSQGCLLYTSPSPRDRG